MGLSTHSRRSDQNLIIHILQSYTLFCNHKLSAPCKLLAQSAMYLIRFLNHKLRMAFSKFYRRHNELVFEIQCRYNITFTSRPIEPEFYGDLVYKFKRIRGMADFSDRFRKIIMRYKRIGSYLNVMRQSACLVINQIMVNGFAALFNCTPVDRAPDSMMAPI